jgi:hypothetical protein
MLDERPSIFISKKLIISSERKLHKDRDRKDSVEEGVTALEYQGA